jgi:hypothetical protein
VKFWETIKGFFVNVFNSFERQAENGVRKILRSRKNVLLLMHVVSVSGQ